MSAIIEGVDGTGKTTFAKNWLLLNPDYFYVHNYTKPKREDDFISEASKEMLILRNHDVVMDRSFIISEYVYSTVLERDTYIDSDRLLSYIYYVNMQKHTLVLCTYRDIKNVVLKEEDKWLPIKELSALYTYLFIESKLINLTDIRYIEDQINTEEQNYENY